MANNKKENKIEKFTKEAIGKTLNQFNKEIGIADLVEVNKNQDRMLNGILSQVNDESTEKTEKSNIITLDNSTDGIVELKEIQGDTNVNVSKIEEDMPITNDIGDKEGNIFSLNEVTQGVINIGEIEGNTLVNCNKDDKKELVLMKDLSTQGDNNITLTEGVDGGLVDVALEGNTLVNVSKTKDSTAISKSYTVENSGNHIALQGDVDGSCRPVITGKTLLNLAYEPTVVSVAEHISNKYVFNDFRIMGQSILQWKDKSLFKSGATYTVIITIENTCSEAITFNSGYDISGDRWFTIDTVNANSVKTIKFTKTYTATDPGLNALNFTTQKSGVSFAIHDDIFILEGDYTNKPIPDYFTGLQSSFEDNLVTQEMVDNGEEVADNLGKYKVEYKVTGKNLFDKNKGLSDNIYTYYIPCRPNTSYTVNNGGVIWFYDKNKKNLGYVASSKPSPSNARYLRKRLADTIDEAVAKVDTLQVEEGSVATAYEPYKEYTKTLYLNSPLLEGDTIEEKDNGIYHVHRSGKVVLDGSDDEEITVTPPREDGFTSFILRTPEVNLINKEITDVICDTLPSDSTQYWYDCTTTNIYKWSDTSADFVGVLNGNNVAVRQWLQQNPTTVVYELAEPQYELIKQSNLAIPSYVNGHLDFTSTVPVEKVDFLPFTEELTYLYANTQYTVQFMSDKAITADITLGGTQLLAQSIVTGLNRISITTPETLVDNKLVISGVGANISKVVVTDTDREFDYFEGMKSVGECEELEVVSNNMNLYNPNKNNLIRYGYFVSDGTLQPDNNYVYTNEYIDISCLRGKKVYVSVTENGVLSSSFGYLRFVLYDIYKNVIGVWVTGGSSENGCNVPTNAKYIRFSFASSSNNLPNATILITEDLDRTYIAHQSNSQTLIHAPLRSVGETKDRYVLIDGNWYIERKCGAFTLDGSGNILIRYKPEWSNDNTTAFEIISNDYDTNSGLWSEIDEIKCNLLPNILYSSNIRDNTKNIIGITNYTNHIDFKVSSSAARSLDELNQWLSRNNMHILYKLKTPTYEPIDYNPLEVYSDITHITTNSTIPTNMVIKNHGFNCLLKSSTTYTISSNLGLNTVTTPSTLTEDCLRFMDTDTSDVTTMRDVLVLEGDWTTKADLIPSNFSGIESAFEQEYDAEKGKYKVKAKVVGKNWFDMNNITNGRSDGKFIAKEFNINGSSVTLTGGMAVLKFESKKNTDYYLSCTFKSNQNNDIPRIYIYDKNLNQIYFTNSSNVKFNSNDNDILYIGLYIAMLDGYRGSYSNIQLEQGDTATTYEPYQESNITFYINEPLRGTDTVRDKICIKDDKVVVQRNCGSYIINDGSNFKINNHNNISRNRINRFVFDGILLPNAKDLGDTSCSNICDILPVVSSRDTESADSECISIRGSSNIWGVMICVKQPSVDSFNQWLQQNPITIVYELAEPVYEEVEYSSNRLILNTFNNESFNNSTLFLNTNISPKISLKPLFEELVYVKSNTEYYIQFNAVGSGEVVINLGGTELTTEIVEGYNCIPITTPNESTNLMTIIGQGITISEVIVSEAICGGYYKGLQSCFEEHMENGKYRVLFRGIALDGSKVNGIKLYINEPLRGVGDIKDRLCIKDGKLMVERKCGEIIINDTNPYGISAKNSIYPSVLRIFLHSSNIPNMKRSGGVNILCDTLQYYGAMNKDVIGIGYGDGFDIHLPLPTTSTIDEAREYLKNNPLKIVYQLAEPTYEEVTNEYGLPVVFEGYGNGIVYIDSAVTPTTHIKYTSNNQLAITLSEAEEQNIATQEDINMNVITYMMDIDMMLTDMEMSNDISVMAVRRDSSNENMLDRMSEEDKKVYRDNTVVMLEKMITAKALEKEDIEGRIDMYYNKNRISKEQYKYLKSLL